jgi:hypothetical protein
VRFGSFREFWPYYLGEHRTRACRVLHFVGVTIAFTLFATAVVVWSPWPALAGYVAGFVFAWLGHFFVEKNRPASWRYPIWSLFADWRMWALMVRGRLWREAPVHEQAGISS